MKFYPNKNPDRLNIIIHKQLNIKHQYILWSVWVLFSVSLSDHHQIAASSTVRKTTKHWPAHL